MKRGRVFAIIVSAVIFAIFHPPATIPLAFVFGIVLGVQFLNTKTLWAVIITHATYDLLIVLDWRCLHTVWNPPVTALPMVGLAVASLSSFAIASAAIIFLLKQTGSGTHNAPRM